MGNESTTSADVIVVGGGMVGSLTAAALACCGIDVVLIEKNAPAQFDSAEHDLRVSAVSYATQRMFEAVDAWQSVVLMRACPFRRMLVWDDATDAKTLFDCATIGQQHLGHIVENRVLQLALWERLQELDNVQIYCPSHIEQLDIESTNAVVTLEDEIRVSAPLVIAADGAQSRVRQLAGIDVSGEAYDQHALVASIETAVGQQDITWQRFTSDGPPGVFTAKR